MISSLFLALFTGCVSTSQNNTLTQKQITLKFKNKKLTKPLDKASLQYYPGFCVSEAFTLKSEDIFLEKIQLDSNCNWNGLPRGFFTYLFKDKLKLKSFRMQENIEVDNYELSMYKVNGSSYVSLIHIYGVFNDLFIWDFEGSFYEKVLSSITHKPLRQIQQPRFKANYNHALARYNFIHSYYGRMSESRWEK
jgi:hypothetical protein